MAERLQSNFRVITQFQPHILLALRFRQMMSFRNKTDGCSRLTHCLLPSSVYYRSSYAIDQLGSGGRFKNTFELFNLRALKFSLVIKSTSFNVWARYFVWHFKGTLWNSTQNILSIHWKIWFLYNNEILRALRFKSSYAFLKRPPGPCFPQGRILSTWVLRNDSKYKYCCLSSKLWYLQHNCVGDTIVYY